MGKINGKCVLLRYLFREMFVTIIKLYVLLVVQQ